MDDRVKYIPITDEHILELSVKIEREGLEFYSRMAQLISSPEISDFLTHMAGEEAKHEVLFKKMLEKKDNRLYGWETQSEVRELIIKMLQTDIFPELSDTGDQEKNFENFQKALDFAIESERVSIEFYRLLGDYCDDYEAKSVLAILEKAETEHLAYVISLKDKFSR